MQQPRETAMAGSGLEQPHQGCTGLATIPVEVHLDLQCFASDLPWCFISDRLLADAACAIRSLTLCIPCKLALPCTAVCKTFVLPAGAGESGGKAAST